MTSIGAIEHFSGKDWELYAERLQEFLLANDLGEIKLKDDNSNATVVKARAEKRRAVLLSVIGPATYSLLRNLVSPAKPSEKTFEDLVTALKDHYAPTPSVPVQRFKFQARIRKSGESIAIYVSELRKLAEYCNFGAGLNERLRDQFVSGIADEKLQKKLLAKENLDFDKAYKIALTDEVAIRDAGIFVPTPAVQQTASSVNKVKSVPQRKPTARKEKPTTKQQPTTKYQPTSKYQKYPSSSKRQQRRQCYRCGNPDHLAPDCPMKDKKCNFCHKIGHLSVVCFMKQRSGSVYNVCENENDNAADDDDDYETCVFSVSDQVHDNKPIMKKVKIQGCEMSLQEDSGSSHTLMNIAEFTKNFPAIKLQKSEVKLKAYTGDKISVVGETILEVVENGVEFQLPIVVTEIGPTVIGRIWLNAFAQVDSLPGVHTVVENSLYDDIVHENIALFDNTTVGCLQNVEARLSVDNSKPIFHKARPVPFAMKRKVETSLLDLEQKGIIQKVEYSDWAAPIVPVVKPSGALRLCGDYKVTINKAVKVDTYPLPLVNELFANLAGGQKFTKLDLSEAYHQIKLHPDSQKYTTINTHLGLFEYLRLPYGISTCVGVFQRAMETLLKGLPGVSIYLDDLLVTGKSDEEHRTNLRAVFEKLRENGLRLKREKCKFFMESVEYLGFKISAEGIHPTESKVEAIKAAPPPTNVNELRSFIGIVNYYARFQQNLAHHMAPLYKLLGKGYKWKWGTTERNAFEQIRTTITTDIVLAHYDPDAELVLSCDASPYGIGASLQQKKDGILRPLAFVSRSLSKAEKNYAQIEREGLAIVFGATKFRQYLLGRSWTLLTDHQSLVTLFGEHKAIPQLASARIKRWALTLSAYQYKIRHVPSKENACADYLSRAPLESTEDDSREHTEVLLLQDFTDYRPLSAQVIAKETQRDSILLRVLRMVKEGWPSNVYDSEFQAYLRRRNELAIEQNVLLWGERVIIPKSLQGHLLMDLHSEHDGMVRMKAIARQYFWWPNMDKMIEETCRDCMQCQNNQKLPARSPGTWNWPSGPWKRLHVDYAGPFMNSMFLIVVDAHSKWLEVFQTSHSTSEATIRCLNSVFAKYGLPEHLVSDNGTCFTSAEFKYYLDRYGIRHTTTAPGHPATNGLAERYVGYFKQQMKKLGNLNLSIEEKIHKILFSYRTTPHPATGETPAKLLMGRELRTRFSNLKPSLQTTKDVEFYDKNANATPSYKLNDAVFALNLRSGPRWVPGIIIDCNHKNYYVQVGLQVWKRHEDQLRVRKCCDRESLETNTSEHDEFLENGENSPNEIVSSKTSESVVKDKPEITVVEKGTNVSEKEEANPQNVSHKVAKPEVVKTGTESQSRSTLGETTPRRNPARIRNKPARFRDD